MGAMNLDEIEANLLATSDSSNECVLDLLDPFESDLLGCDKRFGVRDRARSLNYGGVRIPLKARKPRLTLLWPTILLRTCCAL